MVSTRNHPSAFPPPELASPTKSPSKRGASRASSTAPVAQPSNTITTTAPPTLTPTTTTTNPSAWTHTPSNLTLAWLALSLPLVIWDTGYVLLRPHSMPGGSLHWPVWQPYALYGTVDHVYGFPAWERGDGFGAAQASLNAVETALYLAYLAIVYRSGVQRSSSQQGKGAPDKEVVGAKVGGARVVAGRVAAQAVVLAFAAAVMTLSKTVLYWLNEAWGGFDNIGHNDLVTLVFLWIIPNGLWLIFPSYMIYVFGGEIVQGLEAAGAAASIKKSQ